MTNWQKLEMMNAPQEESPLARFSRLAEAVEKARDLASEAEALLELEFEYAGGTLEGLGRPTSQLAVEPYQRACEGLKGYQEALRLLFCYLESGETDLHERSLELAQRSVDSLDLAVAEMGDLEVDYPVLA